MGRRAPSYPKRDALYGRRLVGRAAALLLFVLLVTVVTLGVTHYEQYSAYLAEYLQAPPSARPSGGQPQSTTNIITSNPYDTVDSASSGKTRTARTGGGSAKQSDTKSAKSRKWVRIVVGAGIVLTILVIATALTLSKAGNMTLAPTDATSQQQQQQQRQQQSVKSNGPEPYYFYLPLIIVVSVVVAIGIIVAAAALLHRTPGHVGPEPTLHDRDPFLPVVSAIFRMRGKCGVGAESTWRLLSPELLERREELLAAVLNNVLVFNELLIDEVSPYAGAAIVEGYRGPPPKLVNVRQKQAKDATVQANVCVHTALDLYSLDTAERRAEAIKAAADPLAAAAAAKRKKNKKKKERAADDQKKVWEERPFVFFNPDRISLVVDPEIGIEYYPVPQEHYERQISELSDEHLHGFYNDLNRLALLYVRDYHERRDLESFFSEDLSNVKLLTGT